MEETINQILNYVKPTLFSKIINGITIISFFITSFTLIKVLNINTVYKNKQKNDHFLNRYKTYQEILNNPSKSVPSDLYEQINKLIDRHISEVSMIKKMSLKKKKRNMKNDQESIKDTLSVLIIDNTEGVAK